MFALLLVAFLCGVTADSQAERPSSLRGMEPLAFWAEERRLGDDRRRHWRQEHEHEGEEKDEPWEHQEHHEHEDHREDHWEHHEDHWEHHEDEEHWRPHWGPHPDPRECFPPFDFCQSCVDGGCMGTPCKARCSMCDPCQTCNGFGECIGPTCEIQCALCDSCQTCVGGQCIGSSCQDRCLSCNTMPMMCPNGQTSIPGSCMNGNCMPGSCV
ncbi:unnamed protein product [Symbiodinium necroappetens]|uniref:Uncharacterized protein n=1 Tax=Symbiodinium necroappetens TaxID=1628268 RepID=A0A812VPG8_9DINO|nr:unnamed protein product [Symbiodinium necroappetens]